IILKEHAMQQRGTPSHNQRRTAGSRNLLQCEERGLLLSDGNTNPPTASSKKRKSIIPQGRGRGRRRNNKEITHVSHSPT
ncbi:MAG: hypothetical protein KBC83_04605, partial [Candidatus Moranbacteria bacterium]|nr:hypothetical protein [Candidatus Moranbacteria bacterium]